MPIVYPATNNEEAVQLNVQNANQFHRILQGDINTEVQTFEGLGLIPSVAKAMNEAAAYRVPIAWDSGNDEVDLLQPRIFDNSVYVPVFVPAQMDASPDNSLWRLYRPAVAINQLTETRAGTDIISGDQLPLSTITYLPNTNTLTVFVNRSLYISGVDYTEVSPTRIDFTSGSIPDPSDEIYIISGVTTTTLFDPLYGGTTLRSWRFDGDGTDTYTLLGADTNIPEAYIVNVDGVTLEPTQNYTVDSGAGTITFTDDLGASQTYDSSQRITVLGVGQVIIAQAALGPDSSEDQEIPVFDDTSGKSLGNSPLRLGVSGGLYGHKAEIKEITGTSYTVTESDSGKVLWTTNASPVTVTLPEDATEAVSDGLQGVLIQGGAGVVTFVKEGSDTLVSSGSLVDTAGEGSAVSFFKKQSGIWWLGGERA